MIQNRFVRTFCLEVVNSLFVVVVVLEIVFSDCRNGHDDVLLSSANLSQPDVGVIAVLDEFRDDHCFHLVLD